MPAGQFAQDAPTGAPDKQPARHSRRFPALVGTRHNIDARVVPATDGARDDFGAASTLRLGSRRAVYPLDMSKPFEVEIDCGTANPVRFTLDEDRIRRSGIKVRLAVADGAGDPNDRTRLWRGALTIARELIRVNADGPIEVQDGPDVWLIPESSVRWVRLHDPEPSGRQAVESGFRLRGAGTTDDDDAVSAR